MLLAEFPQLLGNCFIFDFFPEEINFATLLDEPGAGATAEFGFHGRVEEALGALLGRFEDQPPQWPCEEIEEETPERAAGEPATGSWRTAETRVDDEDARVDGEFVRSFVRGEVRLEGIGESHQGEFRHAEHIVLLALVGVVLPRCRGCLAFTSWLRCCCRCVCNGCAFSLL